MGKILKNKESVKKKINNIFRCPLLGTPLLQSLNFLKLHIVPGSIVHKAFSNIQYCTVDSNLPKYSTTKLCFLCDTSDHDQWWVVLMTPLVEGVSDYTATPLQRQGVACELKGTVSRDIRPSFFFSSNSPLRGLIHGPTPLNIGFEFAEIFDAENRQNHIPRSQWDRGIWIFC
jgi:hypothetical protein